MAVIAALLAARPARRPRLAEPLDGVEVLHDEPYAAGDPDARLDVYCSAATGVDTRQPTVIWIHGGAWVTGRKHDAAPYFERLAIAGFTVVAVEYARAPRARYPMAIGQINEAIGYVRRHAGRLHVDDTRLFLAGDSAGAQMASQIAVLATSPSYAAAIGMEPALRSDQLRGIVLFGGVYDGNAVARHDSTIANAALQVFVASVLWAYTGDRDRDSPALRQMSTIDHVTADFPPTFISGGNADPFTAVHSRPFAERLTQLGVEVAGRCYDADYCRPLLHQFQFDLGGPEGQAVFDAVVDFMRRHLD